MKSSPATYDVFFKPIASAPTEDHLMNRDKHLSKKLNSLFQKMSIPVLIRYGLYGHLYKDRRDDQWQLA